MTGINNYMKELQVYSLCERHGLLAATYPHCLDVGRYGHARQKIEALAQKINEPVALVTGDMRMLYIPKSATAGLYGGWTTPIDQKKGEVLSERDMLLPMLLSSDRNIDPLYTLELPVGARLAAVPKRLADLGRRSGGLEILAEGNGGKTLSSRDVMTISPTRPQTGSKGMTRQPRQG